MWVCLSTSTNGFGTLRHYRIIIKIIMLKIIKILVIILVIITKVIMMMIIYI